MNVLLIAQCDKRALTESRRILDQFAERRGDRTWQTPITQQGLDTLHRLLRKTARKNTAVACHWIRGLNHTELLWVVGDRSRFNEQGAVPTNTTRRNILRQNDENNWHSGDPLSNPFVMHLSRLSLMLADHHYSSLQGKHAERVTVQSTNRLVANTLRDGSINQFLDEHLLGVAQHGSEIARFLPEFANHLPRLGHHKVLKQRTKDEHFRWQDKSADVALSMRERSLQHGAFIVNMASTGCGKTLGNARIVYALSDPGTGIGSLESKTNEDQLP